MFKEIQEQALLTYCNEMDSYFDSLQHARTLTPDLVRKFTRLCNSANYISLILRDWSEQIEFLEMQYCVELESKDPAEEFLPEDVEGVLFHAPIEQCNDILSNSLQGLCSVICMNFQGGSQAYFNERFVILIIIFFLI